MQQIAFVSWWVQCPWSPPVTSGSTVRLFTPAVPFQDEEQGLQRKLGFLNLWPSRYWLTANQWQVVRAAAIALGDTLASELSKHTCNLAARYNYWYSLKSHMSQCLLWLVCSISRIYYFHNVPSCNRKRKETLVVKMHSFTISCIEIASKLLGFSRY